MSQPSSSEFERERQRILAEIEARARKRGGELTLQEWLRAAEEVMPDGQAQKDDERDQDTIVSLSTRARRQMTSGRTAASEAGGGVADQAENYGRGEDMDKSEIAAKADRKTFFFAVFIGLVMVTLMIAAGALAYVHLDRQIGRLADVTDSLGERLEQIDARLGNLEKLQGAGEKGALVSELVERVESLEENGAALAGRDQVTEQVRTELAEANVVTEAVLDAKLEQFSQRIEQAIDKRFATILAQIKSLRATTGVQAGMTDSPAHARQAASADGADQDNDSDALSATVLAPKPPATPEAPVLKQQDKPVKQQSAASEDELWLAGQLPVNWTLQLASVLDRDSLVQLRTSKKLHDAKIVRQVRGGRQFFVLILGSYPDRASAKAAAADIRARTGINPWIRPIGDLQKKLP